MGMVFLSLSTFSFSLLFACQHGWNFTFYLLYILPLLAIVTVVTARYQASRYYYYLLSSANVQVSQTRAELEHSAGAGAHCQEVLGNIRTVTACCSQDRETQR